MQCQAVPLAAPEIRAARGALASEHPIAVGPAADSMPRNRASGLLDGGRPSSCWNDDGEYDEYLVPKFQRSNQSARQPPPSHRPQGRRGRRATCGRRSWHGGELARPGEPHGGLHMPWEGYNYEDAIIVSERVVSDIIAHIRAAIS